MRRPRPPTYCTACQARIKPSAIGGICRDCRGKRCNCCDEFIVHADMIGCYCRWCVMMMTWIESAHQGEVGPKHEKIEERLALYTERARDGKELFG